MVVLQNQKLIGTLIALLCSTFLVHAKTDIPVFLLAGQSNMTGYASANDLSSDEKKNVENVKIYMDLTWEGDDSKERKWLPLGPGFGSNGGNIGPELLLGRTLSDSLPGQKIAFIKVSCGSTYLGNNTAKASDCWVPPSSNNGKAGPHYTRMISAIDAAIKSFKSAYDTTQFTPRWAGIVWLQGEFDAYERQLADAYEKNLTCLINDVRTALKTTDLPIIIPMIAADPQWTHYTIVRAAEAAVTKKMKNVDTLDTKGFPVSQGHYTGKGQVKIGTIAAQRWLAMDFKYGPVVSVRPRVLPLSSSPLNPNAQPRNILFDLTGKMVSPTGDVNIQSSMNFGVYIIKNQNSHLQINVK